MQYLKVCRGRPPFQRDNPWLLFLLRPLFKDANVPSAGVASPCSWQVYSARRRPRPSRCSPFSVTAVGFPCPAWKRQLRPTPAFHFAAIGCGPAAGRNAWCHSRQRGQRLRGAYRSGPCRLFQPPIPTSSFSQTPLRNPCPPQRRPNHASVAGGGSGTGQTAHPAACGANFCYFLLFSHGSRDDFHGMSEAGNAAGRGF